jgi:hypothetical protein
MYPERQDTALHFFVLLQKFTTQVIPSMSLEAA